MGTKANGQGDMRVNNQHQLGGGCEGGKEDEERREWVERQNFPGSRPPNVNVPLSLFSVRFLCAMHCEIRNMTVGERDLGKQQRQSKHV